MTIGMMIPELKSLSHCK